MNLRVSRIFGLDVDEFRGCKLDDLVAVRITGLAGLAAIAEL